jgi:hypothetical protein
MKRDGTTGRQSLTAFSIYLRTGRIIAPEPVELKFNPWHDENDGRFTFVGQGRYFPANGADRSRRGNSTLEGERTGRISATTRQEPRADGNDARNRARSRPDHPLNYAKYVILQGDTLSRIAAKRRGLSARDLAWLNRIPVDQPDRKSVV